MDTEKTIQFILEHQAAFSAQLGELQSLVGRIARQQADLLQHVGQFQQGVHEAVMALASEQLRYGQEQTRLAEAQRHTEERLNALIEVVEGVVRRRPSQ